jgi:hypothetical protein
MRNSKGWYATYLSIAVLATSNAELAVVQLDLAVVCQTGEVDATTEGPERIADVVSGVLKLVQAETGAGVGGICGDTDKVDLVGDQVANSTAVDAGNGVARSALAGTEEAEEA